MAALPLVGAIAGVASAISGIVSATSQPDEPKEPPMTVNRAAQLADAKRRAAAQGRSSTILAGQKLGNVGHI